MKEDSFIELIKWAISQETDEKQRKAMEEDLRNYILANLLPTSGLPSFNYPDEETAKGDYLVGFIPDMKPLPFFIQEQEMLRHILIVGSAGSGKTNTMLLLIQQFLETNKPFVIFDWKRNYRDMLAIASNEQKEILVFTVGRDTCPFHFNPLIPPKGTPPSIWMSKLIEIICHAYFLGDGVAYLLSKAIDTLYQEFGVYDGSDCFPTFRNLLSYLQNYKSKGRETQWMISALRAISTLCFKEMDMTLNVGSFPLEKFLDRNVVLELDSLTDSSKVFLIETLLLWLHHYRMAEGKREIFKHACIIEEAHHILSGRWQQITGKETIPDIIIREIRELGESLIILDQNPSLISIPALGNTYTTICMNLKDRTDKNLMASVLQLDEEAKEYLSKLEVGESIVKLQGRHTDPFFVKIPKVEVSKGSVTDDMLKQRMARFYEELGRIRQEFQPEQGIRQNYGQTKDQQNQRTETETTNNLELKPTQKSENRQLANQLSEREKSLLIDILQNPISKVKVRYQRLAMNEYQGNKVQQRLIELKLIEEVKLQNLEGRGYWGKTFKLTESGKRILQQLGFSTDEEETKRKGGLQHRHLINQIAQKLRKEGHEVKEEQPIGQGRTTDMIVDSKVAIEIEREGKNVIENITKNLEAGLKVIIACGEADIGRIREKIRQTKLEDRITLVEVSELMKRPLSELAG